MALMDTFWDEGPSAKAAREAGSIINIHNLKVRVEASA